MLLHQAVTAELPGGRQHTLGWVGEKAQSGRDGGRGVLQNTNQRTAGINGEKATVVSIKMSLSGDRSRLMSFAPRWNPHLGRMRRPVMFRGPRSGRPARQEIIRALGLRIC